ncbi:hypothetical protein C7J88_09565 [Staphylococcus muscae]|uniref:PVL ORF-50-like family n=1 Tax=Staphylococcus muscae TaxID=1294 RepID=A0A240BZY5_9STAP|nr:hypothetical protein [Staphylococcus muscae]AVQ34397.1 hypothetical protein C7J88_09565 [Staphylococcus muscae]PNZ01015.1 hypothetical protein CD131_09680 [Staphylococcus muscae]GGA93407.1 hypothetical protein GCM10007183_17020 [Staphylococcus muscae]SNW00613.1 PVL ORF-50-like family [Staphylococcus muscae]
MELPVIPNDKSRKYEYNGKPISVNQMVKYTGLSASVVRKKLRNGVPIKDILKQRPKLKLTKAQVKKKSTVNLTSAIIEQRLADGWDIDLALELGLNYVGPVDNIVYKTKAGGIDIEIPYEQLMKLEERGITARTISIRVGKGMTLKDAMNTPLEYSNDDLDYTESIEERKCAEALKRYRAKKAQERMNRIKGVPQQIKLSEYGRYLMGQPLIARIKTDVYGNTQLI